MPNVQYDDAAFYIFAFSVLGVYAFPATYLVVGKLLRATTFAKATTSRRLFKGEEEKSKKLKEKMAKGIWTPCFIAQVVTLIIVWILLFILFTSYSSGGDIKQFDPYEILEVDTDATSSEIRRAYRKLSLKYHPDKNKDDPEAASHFMLISKAHEALTDEEAKKNFEEFGSPDGKQQMQVSIGLPSFFMAKDNHTGILIVYLIILVVLVPVGVGTYYASSIKYGDNDIMKGTYDNITTIFKRESHWHPKLFTEAIGAAEEFSELKYKQSDVKELETLYKRWQSMADEGKKVTAKPKVFNPVERDKLVKMSHKGEAKKVHTAFLNNIALTAYLMRVKLSPDNQENARKMLSLAPKLVQAMVKMAFMVGHQTQRSRSWIIVNELIHFQQRLYQCLWEAGNRHKIMYLQFPHLTDDDVKHIGRGRKSKSSNDGFQDFGRLQDFLRQAPEERRGLKNLNDEQKRDVHDVAKIVPNWDVDVEVFVEEEDIISEGSFVTVKFTVTRNEIPEGKTATEIFAPKFPDGKYEAMWFLINTPWPTSAKQLATKLQNVRKISSRERVVEATLQFRAPGVVGTFRMLAAVKSDCYYGCDFQQEVTFEVKPKDSPELTVFERHEEDHELLREMHGELVGGDDDADYSDSDSDSDSDDNDAPVRKSGTAETKDQEEKSSDEESEESSDDSSED